MKTQKDRKVLLGNFKPAILRMIHQALTEPKICKFFMRYLRILAFFTFIKDTAINNIIYLLKTLLYRQSSRFTNILGSNGLRWGKWLTSKK